VRRADLTGALLWLTPLLLGTYFATGAAALEFAMYGLCLVAVLPHVGPFAGSVTRHPANLMLVLLFGTLGVSMAAAFVRTPTPFTMLQAKALAATAVWASVYVVVFSSVRTLDGLERLLRWCNAAALLISLSVFASALAHALGIGFGEVLEYRDGSIRAFGPLGDQVGFVLVLPILTALLASRPLMFGLHLGALFLTGTRGAFFCCLLGLGLYVVAVAMKRVPPVRGRVAWMAAAAVGAAMWLSPAAAVLSTRLAETASASGYALRLAAVETGTRVFRDHPFLGVGFNGFGRDRPAVAEDWLTPASAENGLSRTAKQYVQTATDGGVPALAALVLFVLCTARNAYRVAGWHQASPELAASQFWLLAALVGNLGALWLLAHTVTGFFVFAVAGLSARGAALARADARPCSPGPIL
jgi:O-antigen ligase